MTTQFSLSFVAKEAARLYMQFDTFGRMPQPTTVFGDGGKYSEVRSRCFLPAQSFTLYVPDDVMATATDIEQFREGVIRPLVINGMKRRGLWRSQLRNSLLAQWRVSVDSGQKMAYGNQA